jgi:tetratricopeptide (TPR) repeat protein
MLDLPEVALDELKNIRYTEHARSDFHQLMAAAHRELRHYAESAVHYRIVLQHEPHQLDALLGLAWSEKRIGRLDLCIECMLLAIEHHPEEAIAVYNLACYYALNQQEEEALIWLRKAFTMDKKYVAYIDAETDFDSIRDNQEFRDIVAEFRDKA